MIDINGWMNDFLQKLNDVFVNRVWFVGLQGSYGRGEATETSDIDVVVILDELSASDIQTYQDMLDTLSHRELICGFVSGKDEILNWEPSDLFQFYHDTTPIQGSLDELLPLIDHVAIDRAIKIGAGNIYHGCVHNMLHEKSEEMLKGLYKAASFVVQAIVFKQTGNYIKHQNQLLQVASVEEQMITETFLKYKNGEAVDFNEASRILFEWSKNGLRHYDSIHIHRKRNVRFGGETEAGIDGTHRCHCTGDDGKHLYQRPAYQAWKCASCCSRHYRGPRNGGCGGRNRL